MVQIMVDKSTANGIMNGTEFLEDTIILRVENGLDYYVKVTGSYLRSSCGMALEELVLYQQPVRTVPLPADQELAKIVARNSATIAASAMKMPKELWRLVDALLQVASSHSLLFFANSCITMSLFSEPRVLQRSRTVFDAWELQGGVVATRADRHR
jgi:hypothetical protein